MRVTTTKLFRHRKRSDHKLCEKGNESFEHTKNRSNNLEELLHVRLPDVLERQELSLSLLSKRVMSLILEKHLVLEYFPAPLKILEYF